MATRPCAQSDLTDGTFYPLKSRYDALGQSYFDSLLCFDEEIAFEAYDFDFNQSNLRIIFESCDPSWYAGDCKTPNEIDQWIKDKFIVTV